MCVVALCLASNESTQDNNKGNPAKKQKLQLHQWVNTDSMKDDRCVANFQRRIGKFFREPAQGNVTEQVGALQAAIKKSAVRAFGPPVPVPVAPWVSKRSWQFVGLGGPVRKAMHLFRRAACRSWLPLCFARLATSLPEVFL